MTYTMFGAPLSLYSGKLRCYFRKKGVAWQEKLPSHPDHFTKVMPAVGRIVLPTVLADDGEILQDTSDIIDTLEARHSDNPVIPNGPLGVIALLLETFGDEALLRPAMHYRWNFRDTNDPFLTLEFARSMNPKATLEEAKAIAAPTMAKMNGYLPVLGVTEDTIPALEAAYEDLLARLNAHFADHPYLLGGKPSIADFGFIGPLYAHLGRDPYPANMMKAKAAQVWRWVERMNAPGLDVPELGDTTPEWIDPANLPDTLTDVLRWFSDYYLPEFQGLVAFINAHIAKTDIKAGDPVVSGPDQRSLGGFSYSDGKCTYQVAARHYTLYEIDRAFRAFDGLSADDQAVVRASLAPSGAEAFLEARPARAIARQNFKEVWAEA